MKDLFWQDITDIAIELSENYEEIDPQWISFPDLHQKICDLDCFKDCLLYTSPSPRDRTRSRMPSSA